MQSHKNSHKDETGFLKDQCKEIEENNRMGKTRELSRKSEIPREHFMQRWAQQRTENGMDLTEAEDIKKRWQEYTELYK